MEELWRLSPSPVLCFDGDAAGARAAARAADLALPMLAPDRTLRLATLPAGEDPDTLVRRQGVAGFQAILTAARPLADALYDLLRETAGAATPEQRAAFCAIGWRRRRGAFPTGAGQRVSPRRCWTGSTPQQRGATAWPQRPWPRQRWRHRDGRNGMGLNGSGRGGMPRDGARFQPPRTQPRPQPNAGRTDSERARILTAILLRHPLLLHDVDHAYAAMALDPAQSALRDAIREWADRADVLDSAALIDHLTLSGLQRGCRTSPGRGARAAARLRLARRDASGG